MGTSRILSGLGYHGLPLVGFWLWLI